MVQNRRAHCCHASKWPLPCFPTRATVLDPDGQTHARYHRKHKGLRVIGGDFVVHSKSGRPVSRVTQGMREPITVDVRPAQTAAAAQDYVSTFTFGRTGQVEKVTSELVIYAIGTPRLAYDVEVALLAPGAIREIRRHYIIDANGLNVLNKWDSDHSGAVPAVGQSNYSGAVPLTVNYQVRDQRTGSGYFLSDLTRGNLAIRTNGGLPAFSATNSWSGYNVDGMYRLAIAYDFYANIFGRIGQANVLYASFDPSLGGNAFYYASCNCIGIGL
jgi:zinc metalloprotease ZmpA